MLKRLFLAEGDFGQVGELQPGEAFTLFYEPERAQLTAEGEDGEPDWGVEAVVSMRFADGSAGDLRFPLVRFEEDSTQTTATLQLPEDATSVEVRFRNWSGGDAPAEVWEEGRRFELAPGS